MTKWDGTRGRFVWRKGNWAHDIYQHIESIRGEERSIFVSTYANKCLRTCTCIGDYIPLPVHMKMTSNSTDGFPWSIRAYHHKNEHCWSLFSLLFLLLFLFSSLILSTANTKKFEKLTCRSIQRAEHCSDDIMKSNICQTHMYHPKTFYRWWSQLWGWDS